MDGFQLFALGKCLQADGFNLIGKGDGTQDITVVERVIIHCSHAVRHRDRFQDIALSERGMPYKLYTIGQMEGGQRCVREGAALNAGESAGEGDRCQVLAAVEGVLPNRRNALGNDNAGNRGVLQYTCVNGRALWELEFRNGCIGKSILAKTCYPFGQVELL